MIGQKARLKARTERISKSPNRTEPDFLLDKKPEPSPSPKAHIKARPKPENFKPVQALLFSRTAKITLALFCRQIVSLVKIRAYHQNPQLKEERQIEIRDQCLYNWKVPNDVRKAPPFEEPHVSF